MRQQRTARIARGRKGIPNDRIVEEVDPLMVLARDRWRCQVCGIDTPPHLRGSFADNAPELDHIVPRAAGGEHSYKNTRCSCRRCNYERGGQMSAEMKTETANPTKGVQQP